MMKGWVKLHRQIYDHWLFQENRTFSKFEAWIDLVMMVNHSDNKIMMDGQVYEVERGSLVTSVRKLCDRWGWSNTKVRKFLDVLESEGMLDSKSDTKKTLLTLVNYEKFQGCDEAETTQKRHGNDAETSQKHTNKNVEELENVEEKILYGSFVKLMPSEHKKLIERLGDKRTTEMIERLDHYVGSKGKRYKSHYHTILSWVNKDEKDKPQVQPAQIYSPNMPDHVRKRLEELKTQ